MASEKPLTQRRASFVREYQIDQNGTKAAIRAGYSEKTAAQAATRLLKDAQIVKALVQVNATAQQAVEKKLGAAAGSVAYIVEQAIRVVEETDYAPARVPALALLAKRHPEFRDSALIDKSQNLYLPPGTTLADLRALRDGMK